MISSAVPEVCGFQVAPLNMVECYGYSTRVWYCGHCRQIFALLRESSRAVWQTPYSPSPEETTKKEVYLTRVKLTGITQSWTRKCLLCGIWPVTVTRHTVINTQVRVSLDDTFGYLEEAYISIYRWCNILFPTLRATVSSANRHVPQDHPLCPTAGHDGV